MGLLGKKGWGKGRGMFISTCPALPAESFEGPHPGGGAQSEGAAGFTEQAVLVTPGPCLRLSASGRVLSISA